MRKTAAAALLLMLGCGSAGTWTEPRTGMEFVLVPAGTITIGLTEPDTLRPAPLQRVTLSSPFFLGRYEVTQAQWQAIMGTHPTQFALERVERLEGLERVEGWERLEGWE